MHRELVNAERCVPAAGFPGQEETVSACRSHFVSNGVQYLSQVLGSTLG
jgi:hypothetical protein